MDLLSSFAIRKARKYPADISQLNLPPNIINSLDIQLDIRPWRGLHEFQKTPLRDIFQPLILFDGQQHHGIFSMDADDLGA